MFNLRQWINRAFAKREVYTRTIPSSQLSKFEIEFFKMMETGRFEEARVMIKQMKEQMQGQSYELASSQKKNMELEKLLASREEYIKKTRGEQDKKDIEEAKKSEEVLKKIKSSKQFDIIFNTKLPIMSAIDNENFRDSGGSDRTKWDGFRFLSTEYGPYVQFLVDGGRGKHLPLRTNPPIPLQRFHEAFFNIRNLVQTMKSKGPIPLNIDNKGNFYGTHIIVKPEKENKQ